MGKNGNWKNKALKGVLLSTMMSTMLFSSAFLVGCNQESEGDATLQMGATWYSGAIIPDNQVGKVGDFYFQSNTYEVWKYGDAGWSVIANLKGKDGENAKQIVSVAKTKSEGLVDTYTIEFSDGSKEEFTITNGQAGASGATWHYGENAPTDSVGRRGDFYFMKNGSDVWYYGENGWEVVSNLKGETGKSITKIELKSTNGLIDTYKITFSDNTSFEFTVSNGATGSQGLAGLNGAVWYTNNGAPQSDLGQDGDLYLDTTSYDIYKKESGIWQNIGNIKGESGATWYSGENSPLNSLGRVGDFYLDKVNGDIYKYEVGGWKKYTNIKGQDGKGIAKVEFVASEGLVDKYRITFTDNTSFEFSLSNGADGTLGSDGATWIAKDGEPNVSEGKEGDLYLDTTSYDIYKKESGTWVKKGNIKGESGTTWHSGSDAPTIATGKLGDYYFETDSCDVWKCLDTGWKVVSNLKGQDGKGIVKIENTGTSGRVKTYKITFTDNSIFEFSVSDGEIGESGNDGAVWLTGAVHPSSESGKEGDLYLNTSTYDLFKKANGAWVEIANIKGESGNTWHSGIDTPTLAIGKVGDYYFETDRCVVWEYKSTGWVESVCLKGDAGKGVEKVEFVSSSGLSDTYKITFTDGTFTTFVITNGAAGQPGENGSNGADWLVGNEIIGVEGNITAVIQNAKVGDLYFNSQTCNVYKCVEKDTWVFVANLKGESGEQGDKGEQGEDAQSTSIYIGYDGYLWIGNDRTSQKIADIVGYNGVIDNTLELKNPYYFDNQLIDTTTSAVALTSGYSSVNASTVAEYKVTNYSHMTLTQLSICVDSDGVLEIGVDKLNDNVVNLTNTKVINVTKGLNVIDLDFIIDYDGTLAIGGGQTTVKVFVASGVAASDDYGVFRVSNAEADSQTNSVKDKLILQVKGYGHDYRDYLVRADDNVHGYYCMDCEKDVCFVPHDFVNGCCNSCYYEHQGHTNTQNRYNHSETGHNQICDVCNAGFSEEEHEFENAECTKCGYKHINHTQGYRELDDYYHEVICSVCSVVLTMGEHEYTSSSCGLCIYCNYVHKNHEDYKYEPVDGEKHYVECYVCNYAYRVEDHDFTQGVFVDDFYHGTVCNACCYVATVSEHTFENGVCTVCEYEHTNHSYNSSTNGHCEVCGLMHTDHEPSSIMFFYDEEHANICIICDGLYNFQPHDHYITNINHAVNHNKQCRGCGGVWDEPHSYKDGVCACGYEHTNHTYEKGVCTVCEYECLHTTKLEYYLTNNVNHYHVCDVCDEQYDVGKHNYSNGMCTVCTYEHTGCISNGEYHSDLYYHYKYCTVCNRELDLAEHDFDGGTCKVCNYVHIEHDYETEYSYDDTDHYYKCKVCDEKSSIATHTFDKEAKTGKCLACDYECNNHVLYEYVNTETMHSATCDICGVIYLNGNHEYEDGSCIVCGYEHLTHTYENGKCTVCKYEHINHECDTTYYDRFGSWKECEVCGVYYDEFSHSFVDGECTGCEFKCTSHEIINGECSICKLKHEAHTGTVYNNDLEAHWITCTVCGEYFNIGDHAFESGVCTVCGYEHDCEASRSLSYYPTGSSEKHLKECEVCMLSVEEEHIYNGCTCVCGEEKQHDYNENWVCKECGFEHTEHEYDYLTIDSEYCQKGCLVCGVFEEGSVKEKHSGDCGVCALCGYKSDDEEEGHTYDYGECIFCGYKHANHDWEYDDFGDIAECKICGYVCENHIEGDPYYIEGDDCHYIACVICGVELDWPSHDFDSNNICHECGYHCVNHYWDCDGICSVCYYEHPHTWDGYWCHGCGYHDCEGEDDFRFVTYNADDYYHTRECLQCNKEQDFEHEYTDGICEVCEYRCGHEYDGCKCDICGYENHSYYAGECMSCGQEHENHIWAQGHCTICAVLHENCTFTQGKYECMNDEYHNKLCDTCGNCFAEDHTYSNKDGMCDDCGAVHDCGFDKFDYTSFTIVDIDENTHKKICTVCGNYEITSHMYIYSYLKDEHDHWEECPCGREIGREAHHFEYSEQLEDYVCYTCGHVHTEHETRYENTSDSEHAIVCDLCGHEETEMHNLFENPIGNAKGHYYVCECGYKSTTYDHFFTSNQGVAAEYCQV